MARPKKIKIEEMQAADGENVSVETKQPRTVYEVLGQKSHKYKTTDRDEYTRFIKSMAMTELQAHAYECGVLPIDNRAQLTERLIREFCAQTSAYNSSVTRRDTFADLRKDTAQLADVKSLLARGK